MVSKVDFAIIYVVGFQKVHIFMQTSQTIDARKEAAVHMISNTVDDSPHKVTIFLFHNSLVLADPTIVG